MRSLFSFSLSLSLSLSLYFFPFTWHSLLPPVVVHRRWLTFLLTIVCELMKSCYYASPPLNWRVLTLQWISFVFLDQDSSVPMFEANYCPGPCVCVEWPGREGVCRACDAPTGVLRRPHAKWFLQEFGGLLNCEYFSVDWVSVILLLNYFISRPSGFFFFFLQMNN